MSKCPDVQLSRVVQRSFYFRASAFEAASNPAPIQSPAEFSAVINLKLEHLGGEWRWEVGVAIRGVVPDA